MIVWRYLSTEYAFQAFETGVWKIGQVLQLNDPLDCQPVVYRTRRSKNPEPVSPYILQHLVETVGLLCYSERIDDPAVWAHYGSNHSGAAFGFVFPDTEAPTKISYVKKRPKVFLSEIEEAQGSSKITDIIAKGWGTKAPGWKFEAEHRHYLHLHSNGVEFKRPHFFRRVPWERLNYVVLGVRSPATILEFMKLSERIPNHDGQLTFSVSKAILDPVRNRIDHRLAMKDGAILEWK